MNAAADETRPTEFMTTYNNHNSMAATPGDRQSPPYNSVDRNLTVDEVLTVLHEISFWVRSKPREDFPKMLLDDYDERCWGLKEKHMLPFFENLQDVFLFKAMRKEWLSLINAKTTMRQVAEFIAARAPYDEIKPLCILGRPCLKAGIFQTLADSTHRITGAEAHIGPSTPIRDVMNASQRYQLLGRFWYWCKDAHTIPRLSRISRLATAFWWCFAIVVVGGGFGYLAKALSDDGFPPGEIWSLLSEFALTLAFYALLALPFLWAMGWLRKNSDPLHKSVRTFRDLVVLMEPHLREWRPASAQPES